MANRSLTHVKYKQSFQAFDKLIQESNVDQLSGDEKFYIYRSLLDDAIMKKISEIGKLSLVDYVKIFMSTLPIVKVQHFDKEYSLTTPANKYDNQLQFVDTLSKAKPSYEYFAIYDILQGIWLDISSSATMFMLVTHVLKARISANRKIYDFIELFKNVYPNSEEYELPIVQEYPLYKMSNSQDRFNVLVYTNSQGYSMSKKRFVDVAPSFFITSKLSHDLTPAKKLKDFKQKCEQFDRFFDDLSSNDQEMKRALIQLCICALLDFFPNKECVILYGGAGTGKSTFIDVLIALVGQSNCVNIPLDSFSKDTHLARIGNSRVIYAYDNDANVNLFKNGVFKLIISKESFPFDRKFQSAAMNQFTGLVIQALNSMPKIPADETDAMNDRLFLIHFKNVFRNTSKEKTDYGKELTSEENIQYLISYLLQSEHSAYFTKVKRIAAHEDLKLNLVDSQNSVTVFAKKVLPELLANDALISSHLYSLYVDFNADFNAGGRPFSQRKFEQLIAKPLNALGYVDSSNNQNQHPFKLRFNRLKTLGLYDEQTLVNSIECETKCLLNMIHSHSTDKKTVQLKYFYRSASESAQYDITLEDIQAFNLKDRMFQIKLDRFLMKVYAKALEESDTQLLALSEQYREAQSSADNKQLQKLLEMMYNLYN